MSQRQQLERISEIDRQIRAELYPNAERLKSPVAVDLGAQVTEELRAAGQGIRSKNVTY